MSADGRRAPDGSGSARDREWTDEAARCHSSTEVIDAADVTDEILLVAKFLEAQWFSQNVWIDWRTFFSDLDGSVIPSTGRELDLGDRYGSPAMSRIQRCIQNRRMARIARWKLTAAHHDEDPPGPVAVGPSAAVERPTDAGDPPHVRDGHDDQQPQRYGSDRARRFTEIESRIIARETIRREDVGDFPDDDLRLRLREASTDARRRRQVAESGRLARVRRLRIAQPQSPALGRWLS